MKPNPRYARCLLLPCLLTACMSSPPLEQELIARSADPVEAMTALEQRVRSEPGNHELRAAYIRQRDRLASEYLVAADQARSLGQFERAEHLLLQVREFDPDNPRAQAVLAALADDARRQGQLAEAAEEIRRGDTAQAERLVRSVLAEAPGNPRARELLRNIDEKRMLERQNQAVSKGALAKKVTLQFRNASLRVPMDLRVAVARPAANAGVAAVGTATVVATSRTMSRVSEPSSSSPTPTATTSSAAIVVAAARGARRPLAATARPPE